MDFHTLARRDLQALCKKNKIPANISNVAMADALKALEFIKGIEEGMKLLESETMAVESPEKSDMISSAPRTGRRTAVCKTAKKESENSQTITRTRRLTRKIAPEILDEMKNKAALESPAAPTGRRQRAAGPKMETLLKECLDNEEDREQILHKKKDLTKTPGTVMTSRRKEMPKEKSSVCQVYSTRRSARLAAKLYGSSIQETEASENGTCGSLTVEADGVMNINSKLRSLHLDEEHMTVDSTSASGGFQNQSLAGKAITNELDDIYANVELSSGSKESNDVEMDLQEGADLKLKCQEVVADNMAVSEKLDDDDDDKPEVPYTDSSALCENKNESFVRKEVNVEMHQSSEDFATEEPSDIYIIGKERNDAGMVMQECDQEIQLECQEVFGDDKSKVPNTSEISECVVENADALCSTEIFLVADSTVCLSGNGNRTLASDEQNVVVDTHPSSEMKLEEYVVKNVDEPNTNQIFGGVMQPLDDGEKVEDETFHCMAKEDEEALLLSKQFGDDTNIGEMPSDSEESEEHNVIINLQVNNGEKVEDETFYCMVKEDEEALLLSMQFGDDTNIGEMTSDSEESEEHNVIINLQVNTTIVDDEVEEGENILLSKQVGNDIRETDSDSEESEGVINNLQVDTTPMDVKISDGEKDLLQSKELGKMSFDSDESQKQCVVINLQDDKILLLSKQLGETASHSEEPEEGVIINLQVDTTSINVGISDDEKDPLLSKQLVKIMSFYPETSEDVIINPLVGEDVGDNDGKTKSDSNNTTDVDEGKNSAKFDQEENDAETLLVPQQPSISTLVFSDDKENIDTREGMELDLTKKKKDGNNLDEMSIRQLCKKLKELNPYHSQQVEEEHEDGDGAPPPFHARNNKKQKWRKGGKAFVAQRTAENRPALQQVPHNCLVGNSKKQLPLI
ncbi:unnamed protein product [Cuscuta campestris]|uniref:Uncharacterized protein n=1 Tax=Cuscuta campestris TaxID=132261 RepID=A0A484KVD9_9ASTE|nr:unnamed protein product [Cuscuta campestris]